MFGEQTVRPVKNGLYSFTSNRKGNKKVKLGRLTTGPGLESWKNRMEVDHENTTCVRVYACDISVKDRIYSLFALTC